MPGYVTGGKMILASVIWYAISIVIVVQVLMRVCEYLKETIVMNINQLINHARDSD